MLKRYQEKYPNHGPRILKKDKEEDQYDEEIQQLLKKNMSSFQQKEKKN
jgi:hypothetical protein